MFTPNKTELLQLIREATEREPFYLFVSRDDSYDLVQADLVEVNIGITDGNGNYATRALPTNEGTTMNEQNAQTAAPAAAAQAATSGFQFTVVDASTLDFKRRAGPNKGPGKYDAAFDSLEVGKAFAVAPTEAMPNPGRSLASTLSAHNKKHATPTGETKTVTIKGVAHERELYTYSKKFEGRVLSNGGYGITRVI